jgi:hypothetical protein
MRETSELGDGPCAVVERDHHVEEFRFEGAAVLVGEV